MARAVLITGGNRGEVRSLLDRAKELIEERIGAVTKASAHYESEPWGFEAEQRFWNQVLEVETALEPEELLTATQSIEAELGRDRIREGAEKAQSGQHYASRSMDVDILFYDERVLLTERLTLPHPRIAEREFVLRPLCEILPQKRHPESGATMEELLQRLTQQPAKISEPNKTR